MSLPVSHSVVFVSLYNVVKSPIFGLQQIMNICRYKRIPYWAWCNLRHNLEITLVSELYWIIFKLFMPKETILGLIVILLYAWIIFFIQSFFFAMHAQPDVFHVESHLFTRAFLKIPAMLAVKSVEYNSK